MKTLFSLTVLTSLIIGSQFNAPLPSLPAQVSTATATPTEVVTETPAAEPTASPTETVVPVTETSTPVAETATPVSTATMTATLLPSVISTPPSLSLYTNPDFITPGGNLMLNWVIEGITLVGRTLVLQITLPADFSLQGSNDGVFDEASHALTIPVNALSGQIHLRTGNSANDAVFDAVLSEGTETRANTSLFVPFHEQFVLDQKGGTIEAMGGKVKIQFPKDALTEKANIRIGNPSGNAAPVYSLLGKPFEIKAHGQQSGNELKQFSKELTISISYADLGIAGESEGDLHLYWYNPEIKEWEALPSRVDKKTKTLIAYTDHFTVFDMDVNNWQSSHLPTVDSFQVSNFTGAATYSLPIEVPPGPGGFQPSLTLNYNSQVVDQSTLNTQASWVGMGWSLDTGSIELDTHGTPNSNADDTHLLNVGGVSTRIVKDPSGVYHAADENFWQISYNGIWTVKDKQGNTYTFGEVSVYPYRGGCDDTWATHRWLLTKVSNIFGQEIIYTYADQTNQVKFYQNCVWELVWPNTATYPETVTYTVSPNSNGKYRVRFDRGSEPNRWDYPSGWDTDKVFHTFEKYRLQNIYVEQDSNGDGNFETIIRRYQFEYKGDTDSDNIFPGYRWTAGGRTSTLKSVRQYGVGGTTSLPATTFTYGDNLHLTRADNGYGGATEFDYELWYYSANARNSYTVEVKFGHSGHPCNFDADEDAPAQPWDERPGGGAGDIVDCGNQDGVPGKMNIWGNTTATAGNIVNHGQSDYGVNQSKDLVRPGGVYKLTATITNLTSGMSAQVGLYNGAGDDWGTVNPADSTYIVKLSPNASKAEPLIKVTGGNWTDKFATVPYFKFQLLTSVYRVVKKRVFSGSGLTQYYESIYDYKNNGVDTAGVNDAVNSPNGTCSPGSTYCYQYFESFSEFRGHARVTETSPDGRKTVTQFHQDDLLRGRPISVTTSAGSSPLSRVDYSYASVPLPMAGIGVLDCGCSASYIGVSRNFVYTDAVDNSVYSANGSSTSTRTDYDYESMYGNLILEKDQSLNGTIWATYRQKDHIYAPNNSATRYLVSLPVADRVLDPAGNILASTLYYYDGNTGGPVTPPVDGKLTAIRTRMNLAGTQFSQVSYGYDAWGNRNSVTMYSGYSTSNSTSPTTGAAATITIYDPTFHTYPISQTTPATQNAPSGLTTNWTYDYTLGVPLTESDANDSAGNDTTISAAYDAFGRMTKLIRPGDSSASPTVALAYQDSFPFTTTLTQKIDNTKSYTIQRVYDGMGRQTKLVSGGSIVDTIYVSPTQTKQSLPYFAGETPVYTTSTVDLTAHTTTVTAPDGASTVTYTDGLTTTVTDARGNSTTTQADVWGRTANVIPPTGPSLAYTYDELNRLVTTIRGGNVTSSVGTNPGVTNLVSWWGMNETSGTRNDSHSTNHLADTNTVEPAVKKGNAADFEKDNSEYLSRASSAQLQMSASDIYVGAWIKAEDTMVSNPNVISKLGANREFNLRVLPSGVVQFIVYDTANTGYTIASTTATITYGAWYYVEGWTDKANRTVYVNINNGTPASATWAAGENRNGAGSAPLMVGARADSAGNGGECWDGLIDETVYYKRKLTSTERTWLYNSGNGRAYADLADPSSPGVTSLVSWWGMNETSGTRNDSHGTNHLADTNTVEPAVKKGNAADFEKNNLEYLSRASSTQLQMSASDIYVGAWIKAEGLMVSSPNVISKIGANREFNLRVLPSGVVQFIVYDTANTGYTIASTTATITYGQWYYVEGWTDKANRTVYVNINNGTPAGATWTVGENRDGVGTAPLMVGARADSTGNAGEHWDGLIDEAIYYKRVLSAAERGWLYNNGNGRSYADLTAPPPSPITTTTTITYDAAGRKTAMSDPEMGNWTYAYDALGSLTEQTDARGCVLTLGYDGLNRLLNKSSSGSGCSVQINTAYAYDAGTNGKGRRTSMTSGSGSELVANSWTYDTRGRIASETAMGYTTNWTYNSADLPLTMKYPDNETVNYNYNSRMLLDSVIGTNTYVSSTLYDSASRMTSRALGNGLTQAYTYYPWSAPAQGGRLQNLTTGSLQNINYTYDPAGNISQITNNIASETNTYSYDALDRLISWNLNGTTETYGYNTATGNLETKAGLNLTYGDTNHKHAVTNAASNTYQYDANGNQTTRVIGADTYLLSYDAENRLVEVKKNTVVIATFIYDGDGNRVKSVMGSETILFVGGHYEITNPGSGQTVSKYYFAGAQRIAMRKYTIPQSMTVEYLLGDHLGSTSITTDANGAKVSEMRYKPWGEVRYSWTSGASTTPAYTLSSYTFTGQYSYMDDPSTSGVTEGFGLMFYNARMYDPSLGRFAQADSILDNPVTGWDRYSYVRNNPIMFTDPSGHCIDEDGDGQCEKKINYFAQSESGVADILDRGILSKGANKLYDLYLKMYGDESGWWWDEYGSGGFSIWEFMAIQWGLERDWYPNVKNFSEALSNASAVWCQSKPACSMNTPEWNLNFLAAYSKRPQKGVSDCVSNRSCDIASVVRRPPLSGSMQIVAAIQQRSPLSVDPVEPGDLYSVGNVSLSSDVLMKMIKRGMVFQAWGSGNTMVMLRKCESDLFGYAASNNGTRDINKVNYGKFCG